MPDTPQVSSGPTQNYDDPALDRWQPRPTLAWVVRAVVYLLPPLVAVGLGWLAARLVPASRLGLNPWVWLAGEVLLSTGVVLLVSRATRRLLPLTALLSMALVFPDQAPSRLSVAVRTHSPAALRRRVADVQAKGVAPGGEAAHATELLGLVAALSLHDHATRGHSERVQGYAALIAQQMNLPEQDAARLRWAALLHDIGKLRVPGEILNKKGRPTDEEWRVLTTHPHAGIDLVAPLADYLGDWVDAIAQHHERWDGQGYPLRLAGHQIHLGARIIAVADTYDVITSTRSYKEAMPAAQARAELARCAGSQFDPVVVRAFLEVGLGRLRLNAGPLSALTSLPGFRVVPLPDLGSASAGAASLLTTGSAASTAALGLLVGAVAAPALADAPPVAAAPDVVAVAPSEGPAPHTDSPAAGPADLPGPGAPEPSPSATPSAGPGETPSAEPTATPTATADPAPADPSAAPSAAPPTAPPAGPPAAPPSATPSAAPPSAAPAGTGGGQGAQGGQSGNQASCRKVSPDERTSCPLAGATLTGDWSHVDLTGLDLHGAVLSGATFAHAVFDGANLSGITAVGSSFAHASFAGADLKNATITLSGLDQSTFADASLQGASLSGTSLVKAVFDRANVDGLTLSATNLTDASFVGATGTPTGTSLAGFNKTVCPSGTVQNTSCW